MSAERKSIRGKVGDVLSIPLSGGRHGYAWVLSKSLMAFFDYFSPSDAAVSVQELVTKPIAFKIWVMKHAVTDGTWPIIGRVPVPGELMKSPEFFKQDPLNGRLSITLNGGDERPASLDDCRSLERAAVWEPSHVVERLEDQFAGRENKWVKSLRPKR